MAVATGYMVSKNFGWNTQQIYRIAQKLPDSSKLKFGGFDYSPVITKIPSGYARTGAYIRQRAQEAGDGSHVFYLGLCDFDTLGDRIETAPFGIEGNVFIAVYDTGEFIYIGGYTALGLELLDPLSLNPIGFMIWQSMDNSAIFATQSAVTHGSVTVILPEPIRVGDTVKVSKVYFITPLGLAVTRHLYSGYTPNTYYGLHVQVGSKRFIQIGPYLIDITDEV